MSTDLSLQEKYAKMLSIYPFFSFYIKSYKFWNWHTEAFNGNVMVSCSWKIRFLRQGSRIYFKNCLPIANEIKLSGYDRSKYDICQEIQSSKDSDLSEYLHLLRLSLQIPLNVYVWTFVLVLVPIHSLNIGIMLKQVEWSWQYGFVKKCCFVWLLW